MKYSIFISILIFISFYSCKNDDNSKGFPSITTSSNLSITEEGVVVNAEIQDNVFFEIIDHGFVFSLAKNADEVDNYNQISLGANSSESFFSTQIDHNLINGESYVVKAYVQTKEKMIYGNSVMFISKGSKSPVIKSFYPENTFIGDTLTISGNYFSDRNNENLVYFGKLQIIPFFSTDTLMKVIVPQLTQTANVPLNVEVAGKTDSSAKTYILGIPIVYSYSPAKVFPLEKVKMRGKGLSNVRMATIEGFSCSVSEVTDSTVVFVLPDISKGKKTILLSQLNRVVSIKNQIEVITTEILNIYPTTVLPDSIINIEGKYLSRADNFLIGYFNATITTTTDSLVKLKMNRPFCSGKVIAKNVYTTIATSEQTIRMAPPIIESISPSSVTYGDVINLQGEFYPELMSSSLGIVSFKNKNEAQLFIPWTLNAGVYTIDLSVCTDSYIMNSATFTIPEIEITNVSPMEIKRGTIIIIKVTNLPLNYISDYIHCKLDGKELDIRDVSNGQIVAFVDYLIECSENPYLSIEVGPQQKTFQVPLHFNEPWIKVNPQINLPENSIFTVANGIPYTLSIGESASILKKFDSSLDSWTYSTSLPLFNFIGYRNNGFSVSSELFFQGYDDNRTGIIYKYSLSDNNLNRIKDFPIQLIEDTYNFVINGKAFLGTSKGFFQYDQGADNWIEKEDLPTTWNRISYPIYFTANNKGFVGFNTERITVYGGADIEKTEFWEFNPQTNSWKDLGELPFSVIYLGSAATEYNGKVYMVGKSYESGSTFGEFDPVTYQFRKMVPPPRQMTSNSFLFVLNDFLYFVSVGDYQYKWMYKIPLSDLPKIYK